jgi:hypothetical protein
MKIKEKTKDIYIEDINNIIGVKKCLTRGTFVKHGLEKACDIDSNENVTNFDDFINYIKRLSKNKDIVLKISEFNLKHPLFDSIYTKLGSLDGSFNIILPEINTNNDINNDINNISDINIKQTILNLYNSSNNLENFIKLKEYVYNLITPQWTFDEILIGKKEHHGIIFKLSDKTFTNYYIEVIYLKKPYKYMTLSNFIFFKNMHEASKILKTELINIINNSNIDYYKVVKYVAVLLKKLFFSHEIKNYKLKKQFAKIYEYIYNLRFKYGNLNHNNCININKVFIYNLKLLKYQKKNNKTNKDTYMKKINKYTKLIEKYKNMYKNGQNELNSIFKYHYRNWIQRFESLIKKSIFYI